jgi:uncharacterized protein with GYD domain
MIFVTLARFRKRPTKADMAESDRMTSELEKAGIKTLCWYWTLGRYDSVRVIEAPDEKTALRSLARTPESVQTETMVAIDRKEAAQLLER